MATARISRKNSRTRKEPSGLSTLKQYRLPGGASRLAALLLPQILPVFSVVAPGHSGAALRDPVLLQRRQATRSAVFASRRRATAGRNRPRREADHGLADYMWPRAGGR